MEVEREAARDVGEGGEKRVGERLAGYLKARCSFQGREGGR